MTKTIIRHKSAITGKFVSKKHTIENPATTFAISVHMKPKKERVKTTYSWLIDFPGAKKAVGYNGSGDFGLVEYTDDNVIRFSRKKDAELFIKATVRSLTYPKSIEPIEHGFG